MSLKPLTLPPPEDGHPATNGGSGYDHYFDLPEGIVSLSVPLHDDTIQIAGRALPWSPRGLLEVATDEDCVTTLCLQIDGSPRPIQAERVEGSYPDIIRTKAFRRAVGSLTLRPAPDHGSWALSSESALLVNDMNSTTSFISLVGSCARTKARNSARQAPLPDFFRVSSTEV